MLNDLHRPLLVATFCIPLCTGLAVSTLFGRVIAMMHSKVAISAQGMFAHLLTIVILGLLTVIIAMRTWNMTGESCFLGLGRRGWRAGVIAAFAAGLLLGLASTFLG